MNLSVIRRRSVAWAMVAAILAPSISPAAAATPSPTLAQVPLFVSSPGGSNVVMMFDDSSSMNTSRLPPPAGVSLPSTSTVKINDTGFPEVSTVDEWITRSPALNPLWYNPAITYRPWNDDGKPQPDAVGYTGSLRCGDADANFCNAPFGGSGAEAAAPFTPIDMRSRVDASGKRSRVSTRTGPLQFDLTETLADPAGSVTYNSFDINSNVDDLFTRPPPLAICLDYQWSMGPGWTSETVVVRDAAAEGGQRIETRTVPVSDMWAWRCSDQPGPLGKKEKQVPAHYYLRDANKSIDDPSAYKLVEIQRKDAINDYEVFDAATGLKATRADCAKGDKCSFAEEAQNFANWYTYYRTRLFTAIAVMSHAASEFNGPFYEAIRLGYGSINNFAGNVDPWNPGTTRPALPDIDGVANPGAMVRGVRPFTHASAGRAAFFSWLFSLNGISSTPNREALDAAGRYLSRSDAKGPWSDAPGTSGGAAAKDFNQCRRSYTMLLTDGEWTAATGGAQPLIKGDPVAGLAETSTTHSRSNQLNALRTDNLAPITSAGTGGASYPAFTYRPSDFPQLTATTTSLVDGNPGTLTDVAMYYWNRDLVDGTPNGLVASARDRAFWQHMSTFVVGYGIQSSRTPDAVRADIAAGKPVAWPVVDTQASTITHISRVDDSLRAAIGSGGDFFSAADPVSLKNSIKAAFSQFAGVQGTGTRIGATSGSVSGDDLVFSADFTTQTWTGSIHGYLGVDFVDGKLTPGWEASIPAVRKLFTTLPGATAASAFKAGDKNLATAIGGSDDVVAFLAGDRTRESSFRRRADLLGDIVNSSPRYSGAIDYGNRFNPAGGGGSTYLDYLATKAKRTPVLYAGANDGFLHAFDARKGAGVELFGYAPRAVLASLGELASPSYQHRYYVDGPIVEGDAWSGTFGGWRTAVVGSGGAGPVSLFAIDGDSGSFSDASVLWDLDATAFSGHLGHILAPGVIASTRAKTPTYALVTGNGYESKDGQARLLVVDVKDGTLVADILADDGDTAPNGLGGVAPVFDSNRNIIAAYAGDKHGNLWKFDLGDADPSKWKVGVGSPGVPLFKTDARQPISAAPRVSANPRGGFYVSFGTGQMFDTGDDATADTQAIYVIWDDLRRAATIPSSAVASTSLKTESSSTRSAAAIAVSWGTQMGWRIALDLKDIVGERVIATPEVSGSTLQVNSFAPHANGTLAVCGLNGRSYLYQFELSNAGGRGESIPGTVGGISALYRLTPSAGASKSTDAVRPSGLDAAIPPGSKKCGLGSSGGFVATACTGAIPLRMWRGGTP